MLPPLGRRRALQSLLLAGAGWDTGARAAAPQERIDLWPGMPPDGPGPAGAQAVSASGAITRVARPYIRVLRPDKPNGAAALVVAGGGYVRIVAGKESTPAARWLLSPGVTAFELVYRLPGEGWAQPLVPLQDGQRAVRLIRARAADFGVDPQRIGVLGFSAGAHLAGMTAVAPGAQRYAPVDAADTLSARPAWAALLYPVLTLLPPGDHTRAHRALLGARADPARAAALSVERLVDAHTPPTFLAQAADDPVAPIANSLRMDEALRAAKVPVELHVFDHGGHGWGLGEPGTEPAAWPGLFAQWAARGGCFA
ncbi:alpha/beta hydrolase [Xylophilus sp.]|uniref:alpha/beta hydrolase n=1 Tax=Xylophilus sp. TaxID=2653893 RepID=UPI0013B62554|nr:alpha/beta hydrolase [Xylophilus sp.]KAF1044150.1 MAG: Acetylxylan esterase [Xylophilus sp.]